jgi:hypothetical protein
MDHKKSIEEEMTNAIKRSPVIQTPHQKVDLSQQGASSSDKPTHPGSWQF